MLSFRRQSLQHQLAKPWDTLSGLPILKQASRALAADFNPFRLFARRCSRSALVRSFVPIPLAGISALRARNVALATIDSLEEKPGHDFLRACALTSIGVDFRVTQVVDGTVGVHGMIPKKIFLNDATAYWYRP